MKTESNDPIYPCEVGYEKGERMAARQISNTTEEVIGLTKREYFAAMAMQGILANDRIVNKNESGEKIAHDSVYMADILIKELNKSE